MYNMDNQAMMSNMYQQQAYAQQLNRQQPQNFNQAQNPSAFYGGATGAFANSNTAAAQTVSAPFNLHAQTFVPTNSNAAAAAAQTVQTPFNLHAQTFAPANPLQAQAAAPMVTNSYMYNPNNMANEANILKEKLARRLAKDIEDFQSQLSNFPNFNAMPLKDKLEEWHFNVWPISGVYVDYIINGVIQFPTEYPQKPPSIELSVPFPHPNVKTVSSKAWVHLDILSENKWKQSYSILDIFRELSKVFSYTPRDELGSSVSDDDIRVAQQKLKSFKCMWTGHTSQNPVPKQGQPIPHSKKQINQLHASQPLTIENQAYQWRYCRIKQVECSFGKVYYEARVVSSVLGPNNLTTIQIGWALPPDDDPALGEEFEYVVLGNRYYAHKIGGVIIHKRPFEISHNNELDTGFGEQNDKIACSADFETKEISFYINGHIVGVIKFPKKFTEGEKPLVPVIGLSLASVELNFKNLQHPIDQLSESYLTIQEYLQIDRSDWVWERGSLVDWNVLFTYGLPKGYFKKETNNNDKDEREAQKLREIVLEIFHCLDFQTLSKCREVCKIWGIVINLAYFVPRSRLKCYYSDKSFDSDTYTKLGTMLNIKMESVEEEQQNNVAVVGSKKKAKINYLNHYNLGLISSSSDFISFNVWDKLNIQIDSKHEEFTHFLPIIINEDHGKRIQKILTKQIASITERPGFTADRALFIMTGLLNSVIKRLHCELFLSNKQRTNKQQLVVDSLSLWCHLHHVLLFLCTKFSAMQNIADSKIRSLFLAKKEKLSNVADLGILIMYLLISEQYTWHTIRRLWVEESLSRDCKKLFEAGKNLDILNKLDSDSLADAERLEIMYSATADSRSLTRLLIAFNVCTLSHSKEKGARGETGQNNKLTIEEQLKQYNLRYGSPAAHWSEEIEDKCDEIAASTQWKQYFTGIFVVAPETKVLSSLMFRCFVQGAQSGYYKINSSLPQQAAAPQQLKQQQAPQRQQRQQRQQQPQQRQSPPRQIQSRDNMMGNRMNIGRGDRNQMNNFRGGNMSRGRGAPERTKSNRFKMFDRESRDHRDDGNMNRYNRDSRERGGRYSRDSRGGRERGRGRGPRGRGRGRGRGRRSDDYYDPNFNPNKQVSKYSGFSHAAQAIAQFKQFPEWIRSGANKNGSIEEFNALQKRVMGDLCLGNDSVIVSPPGSGKSTALILSSFYRLYTKKAPAHILFIAVDHIHVEILQYLAQKLGLAVPDLNIIEQIRGSQYIPSRQFSEGRNIFICSPGRAINLCEMGQNELTENLVSVSIFDCDTLLVDPLFLKLKNAFKWIPQNINVNFVACSYCREMEKNMAQLISFDSVKTKKHLMSHNYNNLNFWFVFCAERSLRVPMLNELCKVNPFRQGIVFCAGPHQAKVVQDSLKSMMDNQEMTSFKSCILESDSINDTNQIITQYNNGSIHYIIAHEYSPIHMLYKIHPNNLKIIINFEIRSSSAFLKRANIAKYQAAAKKVHVISLIDNDQTKIYEDVERNCEVQLEELPSNVAEVLCDATAAGANKKNNNDSN